MYRRSINSAVKLAVPIANKNHHWLEKTDWKFLKSTHNIKMNLPLHSFTKINSLYFLGFASYDRQLYQMHLICLMT